MPFKDSHTRFIHWPYKKVKSLSCLTRLGPRNGMKIYISEMCAVRLVSASTVTFAIYTLEACC